MPRDAAGPERGRSRATGRRRRKSWERSVTLPALFEKNEGPGRLRGVCPRHGPYAAGGLNNGAHVRAVTAIGCAGGKGLGPHLLIGQPMSADNGETGEFAVKLLDFFQADKFKVDYGCVSRLNGYSLKHIVKARCLGDYAKVVIERVGEGVRYLAVALSHNYTHWLHEALP